MTINKQALLRAAVKIGAEKWVYIGGGEVLTEEYEVDGLPIADLICECEVVGTSSPKAEFIALANPATVLALLDELEAADAVNKHLELAIRRAEGCSEALRRRAEAAENHLEEMRGYNVDLAEESRQYQQRVAELEAESEERRQFILNGVEMGFIRLPDKDTRDPATATYDRCLNGIQYMPCQKCNDTGMMDSGGTHPWGEPIEIECDCRQQDANTAELVAAGIITKVGE